jgi:hypothetical protein
LPASDDQVNIALTHQELLLITNAVGGDIKRQSELTVTRFELLRLHSKLSRVIRVAIRVKQTIKEKT